MDATAFQWELTKTRVINNDLQCTIFDEKRANEYLRRQLAALRANLGKELQEARVTLGILQEGLKLARITNTELEAHHKTTAEEVLVRTERATSQATQTRASALTHGEKEPRPRRKECEQEPDNQMNPLSGEDESRADYRGPTLTDHHLKKRLLIDSIPREQTPDSRTPGKTRRQLHERQDSSQNSDNKLVLGTVKWFNVKNGYGFINRNDARE